MSKLSTSEASARRTRRSGAMGNSSLDRSTLSKANRRRPKGLLSAKLCVRSVFVLARMTSSRRRALEHIGTTMGGCPDGAVSAVVQSVRSCLALGRMGSWLGDAEVDGRTLGSPLSLAPLCSEEGERKVDALDLADPALAFGLCPSLEKVPGGGDGAAVRSAHAGGAALSVRRLRRPGSKGFSASRPSNLTNSAPKCCNAQAALEEALALPGPPWGGAGAGHILASGIDSGSMPV